jgi:hypothetical protein
MLAVALLEAPLPRRATPIHLGRMTMRDYVPGPLSTGCILWGPLQEDEIGKQHVNKSFPTPDSSLRQFDKKRDIEPAHKILFVGFFQIGFRIQ